MSHEFIIIGAGAYGCAVAYHLARRGRSVKVLEAATVAAGASGGGGKRGVRGNRRDLRELHLMHEAYELWPNLADELGAPTGYVRTGGLSLIEEEAVGMRGGLVAAEAIAYGQSCRGVPTELWGAEAVREHLPQVTPSVKGALYAPRDGVAGQEATTLAYAHAARQHGADIEESCTVTRIVDGASSRGAAVDTAESGRFIATHGVLIAANSMTPELLAENFDYRLPTWTVYPQAIWLRSEHQPQCPFLIGHDSRVLSMKLVQDHTIQLSGGWRGRYDEATGVGAPVEKNVAASIAQLEATFPGLGALQRESIQASRPEAGSADQIPIVDRVPKSQRIFFATGWSGHGWALLPALSGYLADYVAAGKRPHEIAHLSARRFER